MDHINALQTAFNGALFVIWALFLYSMLELRFSSPISLALGLVCFLIWFWSSSTTDAGSLLRTVIGIIDLALFPLLIFKSRWPRVLFSAAIALVVMMLSEMLLLVLFPNEMELFGGLDAASQVDIISMAGTIILSLLFNGLLLWVASRIFGRYKGQLSTREWLLFAPFFASQLTFAFAWYALFTRGPQSRATFIWLGSAAAISAAADIALNFAMKGIAQRAALRAENALLEKQIDAQKEHYAALTEQYENIRRMRHDIASHVHTIKVLLERGETAEAESYTAELLPHTEYKSSLGQCENPVVDAFLFSRIEELRGQGYELSAQVRLPAYLGVANSDLIIAFGNLLDNAAEACREAEERHITLRANEAKGYVVIVTENPQMPETAKAKKRRIPELERGVGFNILRELAQRYEGSFTYREKDGSFTAELVLKERGGVPC